MKAAASKIFPFEILRWIVESCDIIRDTHNTVTTDLNMELSISCDIFWCWDLVKMILDIEIWNVYMLNVQDFCIDMMLCHVERDGTWEVCPICPSAHRPGLETSEIHSRWIRIRIFLVTEIMGMEFGYIVT